MPMYGILLSCLGWSSLLLGFVRQATKIYMQDCCSFTSFFSWMLGMLLSLFYRYYFGRCLSELAQVVPLLFSWGRSNPYSNRLHDLFVTIPRNYVNSFFPRTAGLWNFLPVECFPLTYNLSGFKFRINRHLLTGRSF